MRWFLNPVKLASSIVLVAITVACSSTTSTTSSDTQTAGEANAHEKQAGPPEVGAAKSAESYVRVTRAATNIRLRPDGNAPTIAKARQGDVFKFSDVRGEWFGIFMFGGDERYVHSSGAELTEDVPPMPISEKSRRSACIEIVKAQDHAMREAEGRYPSDFKRQITYERMLYDQNELPVFHKYEIAPAQNGKLVVECAQNRWIPPLQ
jgi:hypothetical protein